MCQPRAQPLKRRERVGVWSVGPAQDPGMKREPGGPAPPSRPSVPGQQLRCRDRVPGPFGKRYAPWPRPPGPALAVPGRSVERPALGCHRRVPQPRTATRHPASIARHLSTVARFETWSLLSSRRVYRLDDRLGRSTFSQFHTRFTLRPIDGSEESRSTESTHRGRTTGRSRTQRGPRQGPNRSGWTFQFAHRVVWSNHAATRHWLSLVIDYATRFAVMPKSRDFTIQFDNCPEVHRTSHRLTANGTHLGERPAAGVL